MEKKQEKKYPSQIRNRDSENMQIERKLVDDIPKKSDRAAEKNSLKGGKNIFTQAEVMKHNTAESCWLTANGVVYDVTSYIRKHPGGANAILRHGGQECSRDFKFHSQKAHYIWKRHAIGKIEGYKNNDYCSIQ